MDESHPTVITGHEDYKVCCYICQAELSVIKWLDLYQYCTIHRNTHLFSSAVTY